MTESEIKVKVAVSIMEKQDAEIQSLRKQRAELLEALKYSRRFLNKKDHDTDFVDEAITKAEAAE